MAAEEGLLINVSTLLPPPGFSQPHMGRRGPSKPQHGKGKQLTAQKRAFQWPAEDAPPKRKPNLPLPQTKKPRKGPQSIREGGRPEPPSKKHLTDGKEGVPGGHDGSRPFVKTSSLFKNNPEIPDIQRTAVEQVQEKVFTSDSFDQLDLHPHLTSTITSILKLSSMTSVQKQAIPVLLRGKDALVRSQTGSGKTLGYAIPLVQSLQKKDPKIQRSDGPYALILVPTRELALQSLETIQTLLKPFTWIVAGVLMGGEKKKSEKARIRKGLNILIATPGRLVDHIKSTKCLHFRRVQWLILDEADRILDLGFEKTVAAILNAINADANKRQNVLLSATLTEGVSRLASISLQDPVCVSVTAQSGGSNAPEVKPCAGEAFGPAPQGAELDGFAVPEKLQQNVVVIPYKLRLVTLAAFILGKCKFEKRHKTIVFFSSCEQVAFHHALFCKVLGEEWRAVGSERSPPRTFACLHGDMQQKERTSVFQDFLQSKTGVLLCTDVAARGLDLPQVTWIVQYNPPASLAEYVHRIGRTARIGSHGNSLLFLAPSEAEYVSLLASHKINVSEMKMENVLSSLMKDDRFQGSQCGRQKSCGTDPQEVRRRATVMQTEFENHVHSNPEMVRWAKKALQSFIRSYAAYPASLKHVFHVRSLHLGHVAKSFGLRDAPSNLSASALPNQRKSRKPKRPDHIQKTSGKHRLAEMLQSEYASGLDSKPCKTDLRILSSRTL
ncbi:probable ATP-dependent RNA helicase DDX31 isoform X2 [Hemicordylus capensis]|uniref:probable ATP-dependent RNA helicase DDX31 isoform X2 n=1 Tax=Hemicordylus capensis TaxID=884348 RepID=UPI0023021478|nr:probable ATP-dependent RNA helicase DDX31 isoform X2 [Hemicordylus capensis]